jgi:hypothetical protein
MHKIRLLVVILERKINILIELSSNLFLSGNTDNIEFYTSIKRFKIA